MVRPAGEAREQVLRRLGSRAARSLHALSHLWCRGTAMGISCCSVLVTVLVRAPRSIDFLLERPRVFNAKKCCHILVHVGAHECDCRCLVCDACVVLFCSERVCPTIQRD